MEADDFAELLEDAELEKELEDAFRKAIGEWTPKTLKGFLKAVRCEAKLDKVESYVSESTALADLRRMFDDEQETMDDVNGPDEDLMDLIREMEIHAPHQEETCFHIEKLRNERRDVQRQIKELRAELSMLTNELDKKREEIAEVRDRQAPSGVLVRCEQEVARLKAEVNKLTQSRLASEREISQNERRLERLRHALGNFMKSDKSIKSEKKSFSTSSFVTAKY